MAYQSVTAISFSPTGNTAGTVKRIAGQIGRALEIPVLFDEITTPDERRRVRQFREDELVVVGTPVYASRVPNLIVPELKRVLKGKNTPAVAVVTFGNRSFGDAVKELQNILLEDGFSPVASCAVVSPHAFASIGEGRPDVADERAVREFCQAVARKLREPSGNPDDADRIREESVGPYYVPKGRDGEPVSFLKAKPVTDEELCTNCGVCVHACPMGSIYEADVSLVPGICIKCQACVTFCPHSAKSFTNQDFLSHKDYLEEHFREPAASVFFV